MRQHAWRRGEYNEGRAVPADGSSLEATSMQRDTWGCQDDYAHALLMGCIPGATGTIATVFNIQYSPLRITELLSTLQNASPFLHSHRKGERFAFHPR